MDKLNVQYPAQLRLFLVGILLYIFFDKLEKVNLYFLSAVALVLLFLFNKNDYFYFLFYPLCIGILVVFLVYVIKIRKISFDFSYSFYILHFPVIQLFLYFKINPNNPIVSFFIIFVFVLVLSYISELFIEKKFINIGKKLLKKEST
jgi:peptidoglycan/LPS O-acetylase OafA/YrhL